MSRSDQNQEGNLVSHANNTDLTNSELEPDVQVLGEVRIPEIREATDSDPGSLGYVVDSALDLEDSSEVEVLEDEEEKIEQHLNSIRISEDVETSNEAVEIEVDEEEEEENIENLNSIPISTDVETSDDAADVDDEEVEDDDDAEMLSVRLQSGFRNQPIRMAGRNCLGIVVAERENDPLDTDSEPGKIFGFYWCLLTGR